MKIAILGTGCVRCAQTVEIVRRAVLQAGADVAIEKVEDLREILKYRVMGTPAVAIDGRVMISGRVPTLEEVLSLLVQA
jgi:small redox-active disulfide protein 2